MRKKDKGCEPRDEGRKSPPSLADALIPDWENHPHSEQIAGDQLPPYGESFLVPSNDGTIDVVYELGIRIDGQDGAVDLFDARFLAATPNLFRLCPV